jgi:hypothetical protein
MFPGHSGGTAFVEYDYMDQRNNWSGTARAPADNNDDKRIRTSFMDLGIQYLLNRSWGISVLVPYWRRDFRTTEGDGNVAEFTHGALGDIRIKGVYTGLSADMSTGITFGLKLASGDSTYANFDPDTQIGSGSTDALLGIYHLGRLSAARPWNYFVQAQWEEPFHSKAVYRPGDEVVAVAGLYYGWDFGSKVKIAPVLQINAAYRGHDAGPLAHPNDSGYTRVLFSPGLQVNVDRVRIYFDAGIPVYTNASGNQLMAPRLWKLNLSYRF